MHRAQRMAESVPGEATIPREVGGRLRLGASFTRSHRGWAVSNGRFLSDVLLLMICCGVVTRHNVMCRSPYGCIFFRASLKLRRHSRELVRYKHHGEPNSLPLQPTAPQVDSWLLHDPDGNVNSCRRWIKS